MTFLIDLSFFMIFAFTAMLWWVPFFILFYVPFSLARHTKNILVRFGRFIEQKSEMNLARWREFKRLVEKARIVERQGKSKYNSIIHDLYKKTVWWTRFEIIHAISYKDTVLDIGCGNGYLAQLIEKTRRAKITCIDVVDYNKTDLPTVIYDGVNLPFEDKTFDVVILSFVLHHSSVPKKLLLEAHRVCRGKVIIYEDDAPIMSSVLEKLHETAYNYLYNINSPVTYRSREEWKLLFKHAGFLVDKEQSYWKFGAMVTPIKQAIFVLKPGGD